MQTQRQRLYVTVFFMAVFLAALFVARRFILPVVWAVILTMASWPVYANLLRRLRGRAVPAALASTLLVAAVFVVPVLMVLDQASRHAPAIAAYIARANLQGIAAPSLLDRLPYGAAAVQQWWATTLAQPHGLAHLFSDVPAIRLSSASGLLRLFGARVVHGLINFGFAFVCLFFCYLNGEVFAHQLDVVGSRYLGQNRWRRYAATVAPSIKATVNGLVLVGLGEGVLLGVAYAVTGVPSPILWAALTAVLAIIPFGAPVVFLAIAVYLLAAGNTGGAIGVAAWGTAVLMIADHAARPKIIGGAGRIPFLVVLFGILGGVESFGLVGLFVGPSIMALMVTLWRESVVEAGAPPGADGSTG